MAILLGEGRLCVVSGLWLRLLDFQTSPCYARSTGRNRPKAVIGEMMDWEPISEARLWDEIISAEGRMSPQISRLWEAIKISPEKWSEKTYGTTGGGFWVVAVIGNRAIWYNDIEDGFNCSSYVVAGKLAEYFCNQDELEMTVQNLLTIIETGRDSTRRCSPPIPGEWQPR